ncbi:MAG: ankyrin repeat domain-containing protein [Betaproteobacteria bacterium]|nr:ankyrin repeat domain-containing protein [Betaproteobacteria bacterium]
MHINRVLQLLLFTIFVVIHGTVAAQSLDEVFKAVHENDRKTVAQLLERGLDANSTDRQGNTLLMVAARLGYRDLVELLIQHKAALDRRSPYGDTALMAASLKGHLDIVKLLVEHGAQVNRSGWTPLGYAAFGGNASVVRYLLAKGADKDAVQPNGDTPLMLAVRNGNAAAARELLYANAELEHAGPDGDTALSLAKKRGDQALIDLLKRAGATR